MSKDYNKVPVKNNMNMEKEVDNNNEEVAQKEKLQQIVSVQPKKVKRSLIGRLVTGVLGPEGLPGIGSYVNDEIIKPALKNIVFDALTSAARMALFKDGGAPPHRGHSHGSRTPSGYRPNTNYNDRYNQQQPAPRDRVVPRGSRHGVEDYSFDYREDAAHVLISLTEHADRYDNVSVADYYDLIGVPSQYTDNNFGWSYDAISRATIMAERGGGYVIKFPSVEVL